MTTRQKPCKDCGRIVPETRDYFGQYKNNLVSGVTIGFRNSCRECMAANTSKHTKNNPAIIGAKNKRRLERSVTTGGQFTEAELSKIRKLLDNRCRFCGTSLGGTGHIEHLTPVSRGGSSFIRNISLACAKCNLAKTNKTLSEFMAWRKERSLFIRNITVDYENPDEPIGKAGRNSVMVP